MVSSLSLIEEFLQEWNSAGDVWEVHQERPD